MDRAPDFRWFGAPHHWPLAAQYAFALAVVALSVLVRWLTDGQLGDRAPFPITLGVLLPLVLLVRPGPFFAAALAGGAGTLYFFIPPRMSFTLEGSAEETMAALFFGMLALATAAAWLSSRASIGRERDRRALRENERRARLRSQQFETLLEKAPLGVYLVDADRRIVQLNPVAQEAMGEVGRDLVGRDLAEVMHSLWPAAYANEIVSIFRQTLETGESFSAPERAERRVDRGVTEFYQWRVDRITLPDGSHGVVCYFRDISEEVLARRRIAASEQRYRTLFDSMDEGFCVLQMLFDAQDHAVDYRWLETNPAFYKHTGLPHAVGRTARELVPDLDPQWIEVYGQVALTGEPARFEAYSIPLRKWIRAEAFRVGPASKRRVALVFADVTERRQAEEGLRASEERLRFALEGAALGTWELDLTTPNPTSSTRSAIHDQIFGYETPLPEWNFEIFLQHVLEEDRPRVAQNFREAQSGGGRHWEFECRIRRADGQLRWLWARGQTMLNSAGRPERMLGLVADITARKTAEIAMREAERRMRLVTDAAPALISYVDAELCYRFNNRGYEQWFGQERTELYGRHLREVLGEQAFEKVRPHAEAALAGQTVEYETKLPYTHGGARYVRAHYVPDVQQDGSVAGYYAMIHDVTESKQAELALREADQRKDEFIAILAHELRNPLAAIRMALDVMDVTAADPPRAAEMKSIIDRQSAQLAHLVEDLLDMSRITRGKITLRKRRLEVGEVIRNLVDDARPQYEANGLELSMDLPEVPVEVDADPARFAQVVNNVLQNACKFTEAGGKVRISLAREGEDAVVRIADSGIGLSREQLARVFETFSQIDNPLTRKAGGLGIGLSLARALIELHGGTIEADSGGLGQGSEFCVRLRALEREADEVPLPALHGSDPRNQSGATAARRILAVDDNSDALAAMTVMLRMKGHEVTMASDGVAALEKARTQRPEVVLLDIGMPGLDGYEVARRIRCEPWGRDMLLVAMTGWGQERDKAAAKQAGFDEHMTKPIDPQVLDGLLAVTAKPATRAGAAPQAAAGTLGG
jgi:PAS domain S-box-containing protein